MTFHAGIQAAEGDAPPPAPGPAAPAAGGGAGATGGAPSAAMGDRELEELLHRLYPRLRHTLADEFLVARERAGVLTDLR